MEFDPAGARWRKSTFAPVHRLAAHRQLACHLPITEQVAARQLSLPCCPAMTATDVQRVIDAMHAIWA
ncbi:DegT/DnrJ/EryC1/StrS family aminotransferase [Kitasatospora sp. NPDC058063]|uniref:DegT/DnrJ/EryC1/StrS family aminotransferase n=1 Tax=unclassified Kitasatospora TaxID=2633591 RepID=UPI0036D939BA